MTKINVNQINLDEGYAIDELETLKQKVMASLRLLKAGNKEADKKTKEEDKAKATKYGMKVARQGETVTANYKGGTVTGKVTKTNVKTFNIDITIDNAPKNIWRHYYDVVKDS